MTLEQLQALPGLISRAKFREVTGLTDDEVSSLVANGMPVWRNKGRRAEGEKAGKRGKGYAKYYAAEAAKVCGFMVTGFAVVAKGKGSNGGG